MKLEKNADGLAPRPMVGVGVMIQNAEGKILMGLRQGSHGAGLWAFPGGSLEFGDSVMETARREVLEETGLVVGELVLVSVFEELQFVKTDGKHFLDLGIKAQYLGGEPQVMEPHKCKEWRWFSPYELPENMFDGSMVMIIAMNTGVIYTPMIP